MPSFDIVSMDHHELSNGEANRELQNHFDFQGVDASYALDKSQIVCLAPSDFKCNKCWIFCAKSWSSAV